MALRTRPVTACCCVLCHPLCQWRGLLVQVHHKPTPLLPGRTARPLTSGFNLICIHRDITFQPNDLAQLYFYQKNPRAWLDPGVAQHGRCWESILSLRQASLALYHRLISSKNNPLGILFAAHATSKSRGLCVIGLVEVEVTSHDI